MSKPDLQTQYADGVSRFERLRISMLTQLGELLESNALPLGVPIESRVKTWASIEEKVQRKEVELEDVRELQDLVGLRIILLFRSDLEAATRLISETFDVVSSEDTGERLGDSEFGYQSQHIVVKIPRSWLEVPSFSSLDDLCVELQVRTLAQHIWAAVSHKLQYKNEESVPPPIRRAINRASALLETVDLEFERVLDARRRYVESAPERAEPDAPLNVDSLALVLSEELPEGNRKDDEPYSDLLKDLSALEITTAAQLRSILRKHMKHVMSIEAERVAERMDSPAPKNEEQRRRFEKGVFYAHAGLVRSALRKEFGREKVNKIHEARRSASPAKKQLARNKKN